jgi:phosphoribosylaminoimidazolecarboxamide formyltransferase/IMP cyclohydrolase
MAIMSEQDNLGLKRIRRALISVSDKTGIVEFARELKNFDIEIISTGGTAKVLRDAGIEVTDVSAVTGFPEMMDGRVKTLHPRIHGALLGLRENAEHQEAMNEHGIEPIDMVVINLYPFEETVAKPDVTLEEAIEQIDIGGPAMIRSAAKNFNDVAVITDPDAYDGTISELKEFGGSLRLNTRMVYAYAAFHTTSRYDQAICSYLDMKICASTTSEEQKTLDDFLRLGLWKKTDLRYGENPHQHAALYATTAVKKREGVAWAELLNGKEMSFNNYVDADAAWQLVNDLDDLGCAIIKHTNPAGVGLGNSSEAAYRKALATDPVSAFGGIVAFNRPVDETAARAVIEIFTEVIIAPEYSADAIEILRTKKNLRVLRNKEISTDDGLDYQQISGGMLVQTRDTHKLRGEDLKIVSRRAPTEEEIRALMFAWTVCKHTKSNAIVYAREDQVVGVGAGQMSRVDSVKIGAMRAQLPVKGSVLASDAFFPFRDGIDEAARHGITAVIQPGGSVKDQEVIQAADEHGLAMVFTGIRHFKH